MLDAIKRLTGWPWFEKATPFQVPFDALTWQNADWFRISRLAAIDVDTFLMKAEIEKARKAKKARKHLYAKLHELTTERLRIERGL